MGYFISFLVAIKDLQTNLMTVKHFYDRSFSFLLEESENPQKKALDYIKENYPEAVDVSAKLCGDDECDDVKCPCDKSLYLLKTQLSHYVYHCPDPLCDCVSKMEYREPVNIDRSIQKAYKSDRCIVSLYYQMI